MRTLSEIKMMADKELEAIKKKKASITQGLEDKKAAGAAGTKRKGAPMVTPSKRGRLEPETDIASPPVGGGKFESINYTYILWGNSQKVQVAGACRLVLVVCATSKSSVGVGSDVLNSRGIVELAVPHSGK